MARKRGFDLVLSYMVGSHLCLIYNLLFNIENGCTRSEPNFISFLTSVILDAKHDNFLFVSI